MRKLPTKTLLFLATLAISAPTLAQIATGDSRTVTEPTFPAVCSTITANKYIVSTTAVNVDPYNPTCGSISGTYGTLGCRGGTSFEPSSSSSSYVAAESLDNTAVQNAMNSCASGQAVELVRGAGGQGGFVMSPFSIPSGVTLLVDAGVTVFASRNLPDYSGTNCGIVVSGTSGCSHWITAPNTTGSGIMGYGILDARGWDVPIGQTSGGFYYNRIQAYCNNHGGAINDSPACTTNSAGNNSYGPNILELINANNFKMYKITLKDAGNFFINWRNSNGGTFWGVKLIAPHEVSNTDGWDPLDSINGTWAYGYISNGDNHMAIKSASAAVSGITVRNTQTGAGIALGLGSATQYGTSNVLITDIVQNGNLFNSQSTGLEIDSSTNNGGPVNTVTFQRDCMVNESSSFKVFSTYGGQTGSHTPVYTGITFKDITVRASTAPYSTGSSGSYVFEGLSGHQATFNFDNVQTLGTVSGDAKYATITVGPRTVDSKLQSIFSAGTSTSVSGSAATGTTPYSCTASMWKPLIGEVNLVAGAARNLANYTAPASPAAFTLQATVIPATAINNRESYAIAQAITFYDNGVAIGTAPLSSNGTLATLALTGVTGGTHTYTAGYPGDSHYAAQQWGTATATVPGGSGPGMPTITNFRGNQTALRGSIVLH